MEKKTLSSYVPVQLRRMRMPKRGCHVTFAKALMRRHPLLSKAKSIADSARLASTGADERWWQQVGNYIQNEARRRE